MHFQSRSVTGVIDSGVMGNLEGPLLLPPCQHLLVAVHTLIGYLDAQTHSSLFYSLASLDKHVNMPGYFNLLECNLQP